MSGQELFWKFNPQTGIATLIEDWGDEGLYIQHHQETRPIVESAKRLASNFDKHFHPKQPFTHVARIPMVEWMKLTALGITKDRKAFNAYLDSREARQFRCDDGRKL